MVSAAASANAPTHHVFGIRHHGPGSARSLRLALESLQPDLILIEGPPDADDLLPLAADPQMQPPVALLVYTPDEVGKSAGKSTTKAAASEATEVTEAAADSDAPADPVTTATAPPRSQAVYYPYARFSPEWQALTFALAQQIPVRHMDLPLGIRFALERAAQEDAARLAETANHDSDVALEAADEALSETPPESPEPETAPDPRLYSDPYALLAEAAGYSDSERWWEHMVETRHDSRELFQGILEIMQALREHAESQPQPAIAADNPHLRYKQQLEPLREAWMRKTIRAAQKEGFRNIAVICGAWHAPALQTLPAAKADNALLKGLPTLKTLATWTPWTHGRLSFDSGYGAGIHAPGWYDHLWQQSEMLDDPRALQQGNIRWLARVAETLRGQGLDISSAHIIETVRLAEALAAMRQRPRPDLEEMNEAIQCVMLFGDALPMQLLTKRLLVGECLGHVPDSTPMTPLQRDLEQQQKRLRLKPSASDSELVLDLRKPNDLERSYLLRQLRLLGIDWGRGGHLASGKGTFKESWRLCWAPEFAIQLIEASHWGNSIAHAANAALCDKAAPGTSLETLAALTHDALYANLPQAVETLIARLHAEAAVNSDVLHLMQALPELARLLRYGDVRKTSVSQVSTVVSGMVTRIAIGLPNACASLNAEAAEQMFDHIQKVQEAITLLETTDYSAQWTQSLHTLLDRPGLNGLLAGKACRLLLSIGALTDSEAARRFGLALSTANKPEDAAAWADGFLRGSGQLLIHDETLWQIIDLWVSQLSADAFQTLLPLLRRTFASFESPERRQMGERVKRQPLNPAALTLGAAATAQVSPLPVATALPPIPLAALTHVALLLGLETQP